MAVQDVLQPRRRMPTRGGTAVAAVAAVAMVLAACGATSTATPTASASPTVVGSASVSTSPSTAVASSSAAGTPGPGDIAIPADPCRLLSTSELQAATGLSFPAGQKQSAGSVVECDWTTGSATVFIIVGPLDAKAFAAHKSAAEAVAGLGDDAYQLTTPLELHVADQNLELTAQVSLGDTVGADRAAELALMQAVVVKLAT